MLLHVTMRHNSDNCPGFNPDLMNRVMEAYSTLDQVAAKHKIVIRDHYQAAPDHIEFMVIEAEDNMALALFFTEALPYKVDFETRVVADRAAMRSMMEEMQRNS